MADVDPALLVGELQRLNDNLREWNETSGKLLNEIREQNRRLKVMGVLTKQIFILNNILLKTSKVAGMSGMIGSLFDGLLKVAQRGR